MTKECEEMLNFLLKERAKRGRGFTNEMTWATLCANIAYLSDSNERHEKFTRWLIGELIKGELDEKAVMNKLVEFGFAERKGWYCADGERRV